MVQLNIKQMTHRCEWKSVDPFIVRKHTIQTYPSVISSCHLFLEGPIHPYIVNIQETTKIHDFLKLLNLRPRSLIRPHMFFPSQYLIKITNTKARQARFVSTKKSHHVSGLVSWIFVSFTIPTRSSAMDPCPFPSPPYQYDTKKFF